MEDNNVYNPFNPRFVEKLSLFQKEQQEKENKLDIENRTTTNEQQLDSSSLNKERINVKNENNINNINMIDINNGNKTVNKNIHTSNNNKNNNNNIKQTQPANINKIKLDNIDRKSKITVNDINSNSVFFKKKEKKINKILFLDKNNRKQCYINYTRFDGRCNNGKFVGKIENDIKNNIIIGTTKKEDDFGKNNLSFYKDIVEGINLIYDNKRKEYLLKIKDSNEDKILCFVITKHKIILNKNKQTVKKYKNIKKFLSIFNKYEKDLNNIPNNFREICDNFKTELNKHIEKIETCKSMSVNNSVIDTHSDIMNKSQILKISKNNNKFFEATRQQKRFNVSSIFSDMHNNINNKNEVGDIEKYIKKQYENENICINDTVYKLVSDNNNNTKNNNDTIVFNLQKITTQNGISSIHNSDNDNKIQLSFKIKRNIKNKQQLNKVSVFIGKIVNNNKFGLLMHNNGIFSSGDIDAFWYCNRNRDTNFNNTIDKLKQMENSGNKNNNNTNDMSNEYKAYKDLLNVVEKELVEKVYCNKIHHYINRN